MSKYFTLADIDQTVAAIRKHSGHQPRIGMILGSGLGPLADAVQQADSVTCAVLPNWPVSTVPGHSGRLVLGELEGKPVMVMQGRAHFYEGYTMAQIGLPVRVMARMGVESLIVTNAAGGVNPDFSPGDLMLIVDQINLIGMGGLNPLRGPNLDELGPRFPDMSRPYDLDLQEIARQSAQEGGFMLREGVYVCLAGPSFETPAEIRFLHRIGVDAVGMSTVPETIVARHSGLRVLGFSGISNKASHDGNTITTHEEVLEAGRVIVPKLTQLIKGVLRRI